MPHDIAFIVITRFQRLCQRSIVQVTAGKQVLPRSACCFNLPMLSFPTHASTFCNPILLSCLQVTAGKQPLPRSAYCFVFPVLQAVLSAPSFSPLHEDALSVVALHVAPGEAIPRAESLRLLYHLLGVVPAYR